MEKHGESWNGKWEWVTKSGTSPSFVAGDGLNFFVRFAASRAAEMIIHIEQSIHRTQMREVTFFAWSLLLMPVIESAAGDTWEVTTFTIRNYIGVDPVKLYVQFLHFQHALSREVKISQLIF